VFNIFFKTRTKSVYLPLAPLGFSRWPCGPKTNKQRPDPFSTPLLDQFNFNERCW